MGGTRPVTAILFGAGQRGFYDYGPYALEKPDELAFVAVAEPNPERRRRFAEAHGIPPERRFDDWRAAIAAGAGGAPLADVCLNATQDREHLASSVAALDAGYDLLLEKPIATRIEESAAIVAAAEARGRVLQVCHVLRHTAFFSAVHEIVASGVLGDVVTAEHRESVGYAHMAHSYVRGTWSRAGDASPMILAKCCHDLDILVWNVGRTVQRVHSFGSLMHFRPENAPPGAPERCIDGCPAADTCPFDARRIYLDPARTGWPVTVITDDLSVEGRTAALRTGPYGRCVYHAGNDVVDHQTVSLDFEGGATGVLIMQGHSPVEERTLRYDGTRATLTGTFRHASGVLEIVEHLGGERTVVDVPPSPSGHGGGDFGLLAAFVKTMRAEPRALHLGREALESHLLAHAAELSRTTGAVISMAAVRQGASACSRTSAADRSGSSHQKA